MANIISAVFDNTMDAQRAVDWLRDSGVTEQAISVVSHHGDNYQASGDLSENHEDAKDAGHAGKGALTGAGVGAGVGALFGLAAAAIPGIGPFITAGVLAETLGVAGGAAAAGAIVGGTSGALASALSSYGVSEAESKYYAGEVERGGTFVGVDLDKTTVDRATIQQAFSRFNGRFHTA